MKKILTVLAAVVALASGMIFTGCDVADDFVAPKDKWVYKDGKGSNSFEYTFGDSESKKTVTFDVYVNYATKAATVNFKNGGKGEVGEGLNVILVPAAESGEGVLNELLGVTKDQIGKIAIFKCFGKSAKATDDDASDDDSGKNYELGTTAWTLIYNFNRFEDMGNKSMANTAEGLELITNLKNLNMKRVLYNMLGDKLLGE